MAKKIERNSMTQTDSQGRVLREPKDNASGEAQNFRWWKCSDAEMPNAITQTVKFMQQHQGSRTEQLVVSTRLYGNTTSYDVIGSAFSRSRGVQSDPLSTRISFNLCQSVIDTLTAKMAKNKVIPTYITNGGIWKIQKKAKQLTKFAQGWGYGEKVHEKAIIAFNDGATWGDGFVHVFERDDKCVVERVLPHEIVVDLLETMCESPRQLHRVKIVDRDVALDMFPELEEAIASAAPANYQEIGGQSTAADLITMIESWHLRSGEAAGDGIHAITVGDQSVIEDYDKDYFPFPHFVYAHRKLGWYGQGAAERLQSLQGEINRSMMLEQRSRWMQGSFKVLLENGSKVVTQHLNNEVGTIVYYSGTPPQYVTPPAIDASNREWIDSLIQKGYMQEGVSQLSAANEKPIGVNSGKAMRTMTDIEDDRFLFVSQQMEDFVLEIYRQAIEVVKEIYKRKGTYEVTFPTTNFMESVDWKDINLNADQYVLKAYPTSSLSDDIAGRLSDIQELMQAGMISPRTGRKLMDMPDVEMNDNLSNAAEDLLHKVIEQMLDDGDYTPPEPTWDLQLGKQLVLEYMNYAEFMNAPEDRLALLRQFNSQIDEMTGVAQQAVQSQAMLEQAAQQAQQAQQGPQGQGQAQAPMANPMPTPQSNLVPNVNTAQSA